LYDALLSGYGMNEQSIWLDALYTVRGAISDGTRRS
jgi:hypothetical protein